MCNKDGSQRKKDKWPVIATTDRKSEYGKYGKKLDLMHADCTVCSFFQVVLGR